MAEYPPLARNFALQGGFVCTPLIVVLSMTFRKKTRAAKVLHTVHTYTPLNLSKR